MWTSAELAIVMAFAGGQVTVFAIYLGPRWLVSVMPILTAFAAAAIMNL